MDPTTARTRPTDYTPSRRSATAHTARGRTLSRRDEQGTLLPVAPTTPPYVPNGPKTAVGFRSLAGPRPGLLCPHPGIACSDSAGPPATGENLGPLPPSPGVCGRSLASMLAHSGLLPFRRSRRSRRSASCGREPATPQTRKRGEEERNPAGARVTPRSTLLIR